MTANELRAQIPYLDKVAYLDSASVAPAFRETLDAMNQYSIECPLNYGVGHFPSAADACRRVDEARERIARFFNAREAGEISFTKNTTEALNTIAYGGPWGNGDEIILTTLEHQSNIMPWLRLVKERGVVLRFAKADKNGFVEAEAIRRLLSDRTKLINVTYVSNIYGTVVPVEEIGKIAHEAGAYFMVDAAQAGGRMPIDVQKIGCDFMGICGRKSMMGPQGTGALYIRRELSEKIKPFSIGSRSGHVLGDGSVMLNEAPYKYEAGVLNTAGAIGLGVAAETLGRIGTERIMSRIIELNQYMIDGLLGIPQVELYGTHDAKKVVGAVSWNVRGMSSDAVAARLGNEYNVCVASGSQGSIYALQPNHVSSVVRSSVHYYSMKEDIDALIGALKDMLK